MSCVDGQTQSRPPVPPISTYICPRRSVITRPVCHGRSGALLHDGRLGRTLTTRCTERGSAGSVCAVSVGSTGGFHSCILVSFRRRVCELGVGQRRERQVEHPCPGVAVMRAALHLPESICPHKPLARVVERQARFSIDNPFPRPAISTVRHEALPNQRLQRSARSRTIH